MDVVSIWLKWWNLFFFKGRIFGNEVRIFSCQGGLMGIPGGVGSSLNFVSNYWA